MGIELKDLILQNINIRPDVFIRKHPVMYTNILKLTANLPESTPLRQRYYHILYDIIEIPSCLKCDHPVAWNPSLKKYRQYCSTKCLANSYSVREQVKQTCIKRYGGIAPACNKTILVKMEKTSFDKYGDSHFNNTKKATQTCLERYGVENPSQLEDIKSKKEETCLNNHGVKYPLQSPEIREQVKQTCTIKYGVENPMQSKKIKQAAHQTCFNNYGYYNPGEVPEIKDRIKSTNIERYGVVSTSQVHISTETLSLLDNVNWLQEQHHTKELTLTQIAKKLKVDASTVSERFKKHLIEIKKFDFSAPEREVFEFISALEVNCISSTYSIIPPFELDIYVPEYNIAIEFNGLYWHSEAAGKDDKYHLNKTELCEAKGIRLIHIFEDEWRDHPQQCKDTLKHFFGKSDKGVYARKTTVKEIPWKIAKEFLRKYHLLGSGTAGNYRIGAYYNDELISVMVFGQSNNEGGDCAVELKRFVTNKQNNPGLGSKMFKFAITNQNYNEVIAFVDRRWFTGLVKDHIGFKVVGYSKPALWWTDGTNRFQRRFKTKKGLIAAGSNPLLTKRKMLLEQGYYRIWDCGKIKCRWTI